MLFYFFFFLQSVCTRVSKKQRNGLALQPFAPEIAFALWLPAYSWFAALFFSFKKQPRASVLSFHLPEIWNDNS